MKINSLLIFRLVAIICTTSVFFSPCFGKTAQEWKSRTIYQLLTDRFARTDGGSQLCDDLSDYCGGSYKGIQDNLDYITDMGFDAIWISPIPKNY
jgi:alpha-amylase